MEFSLMPLLIVSAKTTFHNSGLHALEILVLIKLIVGMVIMFRAQYSYYA